MGMEDYVNEVVRGAIEKKGVDGDWVLDARAALTSLINVAEVDGVDVEEAEGRTELAASAASIADAMAEERNKRGGARKEDPLGEFLEQADKAPLIEAAVAKIIESVQRGAIRGASSAKRRRPKKE